MSELNKALCAFHKEVGTIHKDAKAQYGAFADLAGVLTTVIPPLANNGLSVTQTFVPTEGFEPLLVTTLRHVSGETIESHLPMVVNKGRNALHDWGASCTYLRRYALLSMLCLVADVDTDGAFAEPEKPVATKSEERKRPAKKALKTSEPKALEGTPLNGENRDLVVRLLMDESKKEGGKERIMSLSKAFLAHFKLEGKLSDHLTTEDHAAFVDEWLKSN